MLKRTPKLKFLSTTSIVFAGALLALPLSPVLDATGLTHQSALAAPGGNGKGNANGHDKERGGPSGGPAAAAGGKSKNLSTEDDELSPSESAQAKNADKKALHEAIKDLADLLGGRVNSLHSLNSNGSSSNAASHSAAGLAAGYAEAIEALFSGEDDLEESEETEETSPTAGQLLGSLANAKTTPDEPDDPETQEDDLANAIQSLNDAINGLNSEEQADLSPEEQEAADDEAKEIASDIAEDTRATMDDKESIGLGAVKDGLFGEEEEPEEGEDES